MDWWDEFKFYALIAFVATISCITAQAIVFGLVLLAIHYAW